MPPRRFPLRYCEAEQSGSGSVFHSGGPAVSCLGPATQWRRPIANLAYFRDEGRRHANSTLRTQEAEGPVKLVIVIAAQAALAGVVACALVASLIQRRRQGNRQERPDYRDGLSEDEARRDELGRRSAAKPLTKDEARRIAANIGWLQELLGRK